MKKPEKLKKQDILFFNCAIYFQFGGTSIIGLSAIKVAYLSLFIIIIFWLNDKIGMPNSVPKCFVWNCLFHIVLKIFYTIDKKSFNLHLHLWASLWNPG